MSKRRIVRARKLPKNPEALFLGYQDKWLKDESLFRLMEKSRQIGISWVTAYDFVRDKSLATARTDAWISSRDDIQARLFLEDCKSFAQLLQVAAEDLGLVVIDSEKDIKAYVIEFANGKRIHSMSSNPDAQAGKRGDRGLDEFALHKDNRKLYSIAEPGLTWGGRMSIISTHRGNQNFFAELVREIKERGNPKGISLHTVTLENALDQGFLYKLQQKLPTKHPAQDMTEEEYFAWIRSRAESEETFLQEYMCVPADDAAAFLEWALIAAAEYREHEEWMIPANRMSGQLYLGVDVGRKHDLTVITLLEKLGDVYYTRRMISLERKPFAEQKAVIWSMMRELPIRRACFDATGLGMQMAEEAQTAFGHRVEPVNFSGPVKEELAYPLRGAFEDRKIRIPHDGKLRNDLRAVRKEVTAAGNIRFAADTGPDGHSDRFWSLALALHAGRTAGGPFAFMRMSKDAIRERLGRKAGKHLMKGLWA